MATSGSYNYSLSAQGIVDAAYDKLNLIGLGQVVSARKLQQGMRALNIRVKTYPSLMEKIWGVTKIVKALQSPTIWVDDNDATKNWEAILPHTTDSTNRPTSGATYIPYYKETSTTGASWSTGQTAVSKNSYTLDSNIVEIKNVKLISTTQEKKLKNISRSNYYSKSIRNSDGLPTEYYFEKLPTSANSNIFLYPSPSDTDVTNYVMQLDVIRYPQDFDSSLNTPDFPQEWYMALVYGVALDLASEFPSVSTQKISTISSLFLDAEKKALALDEESGEVRFSIRKITDNSTYRNEGDFDHGE